MAVKSADFKSVLKAIADVEAARKTPLSVSVYLDDSAPAELIGQVRGAFASAAHHARITLAYLVPGQAAAIRAMAQANEAAGNPASSDDLAVLVAGKDASVGEVAAMLRSFGVPVMVVTVSPHMVANLAEKAGFPIPEGDIVSPADQGFASSKAAAVAKRSFQVIGKKRKQDEECPCEVVYDEDGVRMQQVESQPECAEEPIQLDEDAAQRLSSRMGEWVIGASPEKKLAFACALPFVRRPLSLDAVNVTAVENAGVGLLVFVPGADMPVMTLNQIKMLLQIAAAYGQDLDAERIKELAAVVGGGLVFRNVARSAIGVVPVLGWAIRSGVGYAGTIAMGRAAIEYFEKGGGLSGLGGVVGSAAQAVVNTAGEVQSSSEEYASEHPMPVPETSAEVWANRIRSVGATVASAAKPVAKKAADIGADTFASGVATLLKRKQ